jgi:hypothetical protein
MNLDYKTAIYSDPNMFLNTSGNNGATDINGTTAQVSALRAHAIHTIEQVWCPKYYRLTTNRASNGPVIYTCVLNDTTAGATRWYTPTAAPACTLSACVRAQTLSLYSMLCANLQPSRWI